MSTMQPEQAALTKAFEVQSGDFSAAGDASAGIKRVGPGIEDVNQAMVAGYSTAPESVRTLGFGAGMGLPNMQRVSDEFDIQSQLGVGTTIDMAFHLA